MSQAEVKKFRPTEKHPPADQKLDLHGSDAFGNWTVIGFRRNYKCKQHFRTLAEKTPTGTLYYRFLSESGEPIRHVEYWSAQ